MDLIDKINKSLNVSSPTESSPLDNNAARSDDTLCQNAPGPDEASVHPTNEDKSQETLKTSSESLKEANNPSCVNADDSSPLSCGDVGSDDRPKTSPSQKISDTTSAVTVCRPVTPSQQSPAFFSNLMRRKRKKKKDSNASSGATNLSDVIAQVELPSSRNRVTSFHNSSWRSLFCCGCQWKRRYHQRYLDDQRVSGIGGKLSCLSPHNGVYQSGGPVLLQAIQEEDKSKKCLIIDLDETLVHSSFKAVDNADFKVGVDIEGTVHQVFVLKRPYVDQFLKEMANIYECVLFTASLAKYADPVADFLDRWGVFRHRLFRDACVYHRGNYVKDLGRLGRPLDQVVILDNSPASYLFHTTHAVQVSSWFDDPNDHALLDLIPYFQSLAKAPNVPDFLSEHPLPVSVTGVLTAPMLTTIHIPPAHILSPPVSPIVVSATTMTEVQPKGDAASSSSPPNRKSSPTIQKSTPNSSTEPSEEMKS